MGIYMWREYTPTTFTISWTEQSNMSSWWTYSDDAAWLTAGDGAFDDFFWYSAVLLNTSWAETAEMTQSWWVFTGAMTTLWNITSGDNVMIKFPVRWIKMTKSWSTVTLSITKDLNKDWYQYYAHSTWTLSSPWTAKDAFYLGAYKWQVYSSKLKSLSWVKPTGNQTQSSFCTFAKANGSWYNIEWFYQRMYIDALYMMKYWNPNSQSVVWQWYVWGNQTVVTWGTNSQTNATYWTASTTVQCRLFWLEDRWGNISEFVWGAYTNNSNLLYTMLSWWGGTLSWWETTWTTISSWSYDCLSSIAGNNKAIFAPISTVNNYNYSTYYCDYIKVYSSAIFYTGGTYGYGSSAWIFFFNGASSSDKNSEFGARLMYLNWLT